MSYYTLIEQVARIARATRVRDALGCVLPAPVFARGRKWLLRLGRANATADYLETHSVRKLHIAAGPNSLEGWLNTDIDPAWGVVPVDATKRLPFESGIFQYVFSEHFIEHVEYPVACGFLCECHRVLEPGGTIRISTPDLRFLIGLCSEAKNELQLAYVESSIRQYCPHAGAPLDSFVINNFVRAWGHKFIYDYPTLQYTLEQAGFADVRQFAPGESDDGNLRGVEGHGRFIGDAYNRLESMVAQASKPHV